MRQHLISIVIPAYNIENYIGRCLDSVLCQTHENLEVIIVDDGSTDKTGSIIDYYANKDSRIKVIHKENEGVSKARNVGIDCATGDYIGFVDGDDTVEKDMFEFLLENALKYEADISHCGYKMIFPSRVDYYYNTNCIIEQDCKQGINDLLTGAIVEPGLWNKLYKSILFNQIRLNTNIKLNEDLLVNFYLFSKAKKSVFVDEAKYNYILRENSATTSKINVQKLKDYYMVIKEIMIHLDKDTESYHIAYGRYIRSMVRIVEKQKIVLDTEGISFQRNIKTELLEQLGILLKNRNVSVKIKLKVIGILYMDPLYYIVKKLYENLSGNKYKYEVK